MNDLNKSLYLIAGAFDLFPDAIIVVDKHGIIRNANKQIEAVMGYRVDEVVNKELNMLLPERFRGGHHNFVASFFTTTGIRKMGAGIALLGTHKSGAEINIDIALSVIEVGNEKFALAVIRDITDKIRLASQISQLEFFKNELENFAHILTHDLKAPLHKVKSLTQLIHLELSERESEEIKLMINYLNESVQGMKNLIYGVLDYSKAKLNKDRIEADVDLNDVYSNAINMMEVPANFTIHKARELPVVRANNTMMLQVFMNLIYNSVAHTTKEQGRLEVDWREENGILEFDFADNGTPIPEDKRESIFEVSTQLGNTQNKRSHGLGLSIVKEAIVYDSANKVWCEESKFGGCSFKFTWPARHQ